MSKSFFLNIAMPDQPATNQASQPVNSAVDLVAKDSLLSNAAVTKNWRSTSTPLVVIHSWCLIIQARTAFNFCRLCAIQTYSALPNVQFTVPVSLFVNL
jgi:hypothetical protein